MLFCVSLASHLTVLPNASLNLTIGGGAGLNSILYEYRAQNFTATSPLLFLFSLLSLPLFPSLSFPVVSPLDLN